MDQLDRVIAWKIAFEIISRSEESLLLTMLHPCGEQYECLTTIQQSDKCDKSSNMTINLNGTSISFGDTAGELLKPYPELFKKDYIALIQEISRRCHYCLCDKAIRHLYTMGFLIKLLEKDKENRLYITSAWYDGSYNCNLSEYAKQFPYYSYKNSDKSSQHLMWWTISSGHQTIAMCNMETDELITLDGSRFNLQYDMQGAEAAIESQILFVPVRETAWEAETLIRENPEWQERYSNYAKEILENRENIKKMRTSVREWKPLCFYMNVSNAKQLTGSVSFEIRYLGQTVADLVFKNGSINGVFLRTKKYEITNSRDFDCSIPLDMAEWTGASAKSFRNFFKTRPPVRNAGGKGNQEHRIESLLLSEFEKKSSKEKTLLGIQPVEIENVRFPMPTPLGASNHKALKYSGVFGGGIDILARAGRNSGDAKLCIIELKDENRPEEPAREVIKQAVAYAAFIRELLRSNAGADWWKIFGFNGNLPKKLTLLAVCAMPSNDLDDYSFDKTEIEVDGDIIRLQYLYFSECDNKITGINTSLNQWRIQ